MIETFNIFPSFLKVFTGDYWGKEIENISSVFVPMAFLFAFDFISVIVTSSLLCKVTRVNMLHEFNKVFGRYWLFIVVKLAMNVNTYFATTDVTLGGDSTGVNQWIYQEGWLDLVNISKHLTNEEKLILLRSVKPI